MGSQHKRMPTLMEWRMVRVCAYSIIHGQDPEPEGVACTYVPSNVFSPLKGLWQARNQLEMIQRLLSDQILHLAKNGQTQSLPSPVVSHLIKAAVVIRRWPEDLVGEPRPLPCQGNLQQLASYQMKKSALYDMSWLVRLSENFSGCIIHIESYSVFYWRERPK